jgi:abortive infection bacteriophage resistance protein
MTFGDILYLYSSLKDAKLKEEIAAHYNIRNVDIFDNYMSTLRVIRNLCAHGHNIYDLKLIAQNFITFEVNFQMLKIAIDKYNLYLNM